METTILNRDGLYRVLLRRNILKPEYHMTCLSSRTLETAILILLAARPDLLSLSLRVMKSWCLFPKKCGVSNG